MIMVIDSSSIVEKVNHHLAVIGKKRDDVKFGALVVSSGEIGVVDEFVREACINLESASHGVFYGFRRKVGEKTVYELSVNENVKDTDLEENVLLYIVNYALWGLFSMYDMVDWIKVYYDRQEYSYSSLMYYAMERKMGDTDSKLSGTIGSCV